MTFQKSPRPRRSPSRISPIELTPAQLAAVAKSRELIAEPSSNFGLIAFGAVAVLGMILATQVTLMAPPENQVLVAFLSTFTLMAAIGLVAMINHRIAEMRREHEETPYFRALVHHANAAEDVAQFNAQVALHHAAEVKDLSKARELANQRPGIAQRFDDAESVMETQVQLHAAQTAPRRLDLRA